MRAGARNFARERNTVTSGRSELLRVGHRLRGQPPLQQTRRVVVAGATATCLCMALRADPCGRPAYRTHGGACRPRPGTAAVGGKPEEIPGRPRYLVASIPVATTLGAGTQARA